MAENSATLIAGRAVQGVGALAPLTILMANSVPLPKVPTYLGLTGRIFSLASVIGPLLSVAFTGRAGDMAIVMSIADAWTYARDIAG